MESGCDSMSPPERLLLLLSSAMTKKGNRGIWSHIHLHQQMRLHSMARHPRQRRQPPTRHHRLRAPPLLRRHPTAPAGFSGRFWARTGCTFSDDSGSCQTGDCGSGQAECNGSGATPPATLAEFTLGTGGLDFYDVSLVDGYNVAMVVEPTGGSGMCAATGCVTDLNRVSPYELRVGGGEACRSACEAFGSPEYCCSGEFNSPAACRLSVYSQMFKSACPRSYSYAYDDPTSTFTCSGADYTVMFCPSMPSQKSSKDTTPTMPEPIATSVFKTGPDRPVQPVTGAMSGPDGARKPAGAGPVQGRKNRPVNRRFWP